ncbi:hypothetical protein HJFPF1_05563 [Paramyrothecium foliicola]|nr:hypothetical protein HJFPF1_05563 [Paramyrothecium foliicola]
MLPQSFNQQPRLGTYLVPTPSITPSFEHLHLRGVTDALPEAARKPSRRSTSGDPDHSGLFLQEKNDLFERAQAISKAYAAEVSIIILGPNQMAFEYSSMNDPEAGQNNLQDLCIERQNPSHHCDDEDNGEACNDCGTMDLVGEDFSSAFFMDDLSDFFPFQNDMMEQ